MPQPLPAAFIARTAALIGAAETEKLCRALNAPPSVSLRLNPAKAQGIAEILDGFPVKAEAVPWCAGGFYLAERPSFTIDPAFHAGAYYVQEASSMFVAQAIGSIDAPVRCVLDLCAAPGGKSTLWRSLLPDGTLLVANEPLRQRANILAENMAKWGHPDVCVTNAYPADFAPLGGFFDVVATDVPCSGEGMFRKDEDARREWSEANVALCAERQFKIVSEVWPALREGGYLVYSTCTFNREENEDNVQRICRELGAEVIALPVASSWGITGDTTGQGLPVYHFFPHRVRGEGFFLALLRKTAPVAISHRRHTRAVKWATATGARVVTAWLRDTDDFKIFCFDETHLAAVRQSLLADVLRLAASVRTLAVGIPLAEVRGHKYIPLTELALSTVLHPAAFPIVELTREEALAYLHREALILPSSVPRGYVLATYGGYALGFLNNIGTRANNLYPAEWRIRMQGTK